MKPADCRTLPLYVPRDLDLAVRKWGANCGPAAIAACLRRPVCEVIQDMVRHGWPGYTSPRIIRETLTRLEIRFRLTSHDPEDPSRESRLLPEYGLATVQIGGPWESNINAAMHHTHVVAVGRRDAQQVIYDVNADEWLEILDWHEHVMKMIIDTHSGAHGWWIRWAVEVGV